MKLKLCLFILSMSLYNCTNPEIPLYVGTYTNGESEGIYQFYLNTKTGELTNKQLAAKTDNPSYLSYSPSKKYIYAVNENENGTVSSFRVEDNKSLMFLNKVSTHGGHPCHVAINASSKEVAVSNYTGGNASIYTIKENGFLNEAFQVLDHNVDSITSHVHSAFFFKNHLYVSDLGRNSVYNYELNHGNYKLIDSSIVKMADKAGPRHFTVTKNGEFIYIINEYANTITTAKRTNKEFKLIENTSTIDENFKNESYCADIHLSEDERFLYGSNRGENSIVVFKRGITSGKLKKIQTISTRGNWPRNFTLDPSGKFLLVANQRSNNVSVFKINAMDGKLSYIQSVELSSPVFLLF